MPAKPTPKLGNYLDVWGATFDKRRGPLIRRIAAMDDDELNEIEQVLTAPDWKRAKR